MSVKGGFQVGADGRVHGQFTHNPSTLRLSMVGPNLQNIPRGRGGHPAQSWVKEVFVVSEGSVFWARDYSGIEAVLVGYFAGCPRYIRLARLGIHGFLASHILNNPIDLTLTDDEIGRALKALKKAEPVVYDTAKRIVHGSNYMMTPRKMWYEYPETFRSTKEAAELQEVYFDLFPEIPAWHTELCRRVDGTKKRKREDIDGVVNPWSLGVCHARNPFNYVHRFYNVLDWRKAEGKWYSSFGEDAKRLVAFLPQSTAAAIIKRAAKTLWYEYPWVGQTIRLLIHDEIFGECKEEDLERCLTISQKVMEAPIPELPLDPSWKMGSHLWVGTEAKVGTSWGGMQ